MSQPWANTRAESVLYLRRYNGDLIINLPLLIHRNPPLAIQQCMLVKLIIRHQLNTPEKIHTTQSRSAT
jgi:hypothetical protein